MTRKGCITRLPSPWEVEQAKQQFYTEGHDKLHHKLCEVSKSVEKTLFLLRSNLLCGDTYITAYYDGRLGATNQLFYTEGQEYEKLLIASRARRQGWDVKIEVLTYDGEFTPMSKMCTTYKITPLEGTFADDF